MFKIMTFNVRIDVEFDQNNRWTYRYHSIADYIKKELPLILGIQEANQQMMDDLMPLLPMYEYVGMPRSVGNEYSCILFLKEKVKVLSQHTIWLSETPDVSSKIEGSFFPRIATFGHFEIEGKQYCFINTHLDYAGEAVCLKQMEVLLQEASYHDDYKVLMGDFNVTPSSKIHTILENQGWVLPYDQAMLYQSTFHNFEGIVVGQPIDYIYLDPTIEYTNVYIDQKTVKPLHLSDHYPVIAHIR